MIVNFAKEHQIDLTVIGPEVPLCNGLANDLEAAGLMLLGQLNMQLHWKVVKLFSKRLLWLDTVFQLLNIKKLIVMMKPLKQLAKFDYPLVIKADGLAAGKGVVIVEQPWRCYCNFKRNDDWRKSWWSRR